MGAIGHLAERHALKKQVRSDARSRSSAVRNGAKSGTLEIDAFVRDKGKTTQVVIHFDDGTQQIHGGKNAKNQHHIHYDPKNQHYSPCDKSGKIIPIDNHRPGNCLFEALGHSSGETPAQVRQNVSQTLQDHPISSTQGTKIDEIKLGGKMVGGGANKRYDKNAPIQFLSKEDDFRIQELFFEKYGGDVDVRDIHKAMNDLQAMPEKKLYENYKINDNPNKAKNSFYRLHHIDNMDGFSVSYPAKGETGAGKCRAIFTKNAKGMFVLSGITAEHDYANAKSNLSVFKNTLHRVDGKLQLKKRK